MRGFLKVCTHFRMRSDAFLIESETVNSGFAIFGHTRLSILGLTDAGAQPMKSENKDMFWSITGGI